MKKIIRRNILVTAGGTMEPIDSVRSITNTSTGFLGKMISEKFAEDEGVKVFHICAKNSLLPESKKNIEIINSVSDVESLRLAIEKVCKENDINIIIHSAAVSDYRVKEVRSCESGEVIDRGKKISSEVEHPIIVLEKIPKIISDLRNWSKDAIIIGFKLLNNVSFSELKNAAMELMEKNNLDFVLANDSKDLSLEKHKGYLFDKDGRHREFLGKAEIAAGVYGSIKV